VARFLVHPGVIAAGRRTTRPVRRPAGRSAGAWCQSGREFEVRHGVTGFHGCDATPVAIRAHLPSGKMAACTPTSPPPLRRGAVPRAGRRASRGAGDAQGAGRRRDTAVRVPQTGCQPARHFPAGVGRKRRSWSRWSFIGAGSPSALTCAMVKRYGWARCRMTRHRRGPAACAARHLECWPRRRRRGCRRFGGMVGFLPTTWCGGGRAAGVGVDDSSCRTCCCCLHRSGTAVDHHEAHHVDRQRGDWNGTDERVDEAYDDAIARTGRDDRGA